MIGETFISEIQVGPVIVLAYSEHIMNHPPTTAFNTKYFYKNKLFAQVSGITAYTFHLGADSITTSRTGVTRI